MADFIRFVLGNFTLTFLVIGLVASGIALLRAPKPLTAPVMVEALLAYFLLFSIGVSFFYNFVFHVFFGEMAAGFIGWEDGPFQAEVGFASLGFSVVGLPGNAGVIFCTDILIPLIGFVLLWLQHRYAQEAVVAAPAWP